MKNLRWTPDTTLPRPKFETTCWILRTKLLEHDANPQVQEAKRIILKSVHFMAKPQNFPSRSLKSSEADYLNAACRAMTIARGTGRTFGLFICSRDWGNFHYLMKKFGSIRGIALVIMPSDKNVQLQLKLGALQLASSAGDVSIIRRLLDAGVEPSFEHRLFGSALSVAARCGQLEIVHFLAKKAIKADLCWRGTRNPLYLAIDAGHERVVEYLLDRFQISPNES